MKDNCNFNKIKINLEKELDRFSSAIEKIESSIVEIENGDGERAFWNGENA